MELYCRTCFHKVGQGLFYTGEISNREGENSFNFIYDCGSNSPASYRNDAIDKYLVGYHDMKKPIDLVVVSHLHIDHVNGFNKLLPRISANTIIMPYINPIERIIMAIEYISELDEKDYLDILADQNDYFSLLAKPVQYFGEHAQRIIVVGGEPPSRSKKLDNEANQNWGYDNFNQEDNESLSINLEHDPVFEGKCLSADSYLSSMSEKVSYCNYKGEISHLKLWEFVFFCHKKDEGAFKRFKEELEKMKPRPQDNLEYYLNNLDELRKLKELYEAYKPAKNINNTSLVMYHGPIKASKRTEKGEVVFRLKPIYYEGGYICRQRQTNECGTWLLGDIDLKHNYDKMNKHFSDKRLKGVATALIPHHGSTENWDSQILSHVAKEALWVVSHGIGRKKHPALNVVESITQGNHICTSCNEINDVLVDMRIQYKP